MDARIIIEGPTRLFGEAEISRSKNAVLPEMAACLLTEEPITLKDVPDLLDVNTMTRILLGMGVQSQSSGGSLTLRAGELGSVKVPYEHAHRMRASVLLMGALLAREGRAELSLPGGCAIGTRPIDLHLKGFASMGAKIEQGEDFIIASGKLRGARVYLDIPSVGATENILLAATLSEGQTMIENAAREPEIIDLCELLKKMGADIRGAGTDMITITGVNRLHGATHRPIADRIEAATYMIAAAATGGDVFLKNANSAHLRSVINKLTACGAKVIDAPNGIRVRAGSELSPIYIRTASYPGFPTDAQAQFMALCCLAGGTSVITESIFENRFMHVSELRRMGANIRVEDRTAIIEGTQKLFGANVNATDLRAGAAMVIAALCAFGESVIHDPHHIYRGYELIGEKLTRLGAKIKMVE